MRFGLIGYGAWGRHHPPAIKRTPGAELVAIAVPSEASAGQARLDHPDVTIYTDYHNLLRDPRVETVDVVVPNYLHAQVGIDALTAGKNVLLEKPMAINREECDRLIAARDKNHRLLSVAHDYRASKQYIMIKELIDQGEIGTPMYISINLFRNRFREGSGGWRFKAENVGSWILEEPVHFFDLILWYMECHGDPTTVLAFGNGSDEERRLYENFTCIVRYPGAPYAVITQTLGGFEHHTQVQVVGREGSVRTYWSGRMDRTETPSIGFQIRKKGSEFIRGVKECETIELSADGEGSKLQNQMKRVVQAFAQGYAPTSGEEARKRVIICNEAVRSIHEGREIELRF